MDLSSVFNRIHYLIALKNASRDDRITITITPGQLACIGETARRIYNQTFPLLTRDLNYFDDRSLVLRTLSSVRVSFRRNVATLVHYHTMIPRLLRTYCLQATKKKKQKNKTKKKKQKKNKNKKTKTKQQQQQQQKNKQKNKNKQQQQQQKKKNKKKQNKQTPSNHTRSST